MSARITLVSLVALGLLGGCAGHRAPDSITVAPTVAPAPTPAPPVVAEAEPVVPDQPVIAEVVIVDSVDREFLAGMIDHHQYGVELARIGAERSEHPELKALAMDLVGQQQLEIDTMKSFEAAWFIEPTVAEPTPDLVHTPTLEPRPDMLGAPGVAHAPGTGEPLGSYAPPPRQVGYEAKIAALKAAETFDLAFLDAMIVHHEDALRLARVADNGFDHPELQAFTAALVAQHEAEIAQMTGWRSDWYLDSRMGSAPESARVQ